MRKLRFTEEQIIGDLRPVENLLTIRITMVKEC